MAPGERPNSGKQEAPAGQGGKYFGKEQPKDFVSRPDIQALRGDFMGNREEIEREYFGADSVDEVVIAAVSRYNENDRKYQEEKEFAIASLRAAGQKLFDARLKQLEGEGKTIEQTREQLRCLAENFHEMVKAEKTLIKGKTLDLSDKARSDTMNQRELMEFRAFTRSLESLSAGELETMISENLPITQMLREVDSGKPVGGELRFFDKKNQSYQANLDALMHFAMGDKITLVDKEKSRFRKLGEKLMSDAVVRGMKFEQKKDLVLHFCDKAKPAETKKFIEASIIAGTMSREEVKKIQRDAPGRLEELFKFDGQYFGKGDPQKTNLESFLVDAVHEKKVMEQVVAEVVKGRESQSQKNGVKTFLTFNTEAGEMICRLGALTALLNGTLDVMDSINTMTEKGYSWPRAIAEGLKDAAKDPYVWGGIAAAAIGAEIVYPYMKDFLYSPSSKEKEAVFERSGLRFLKEQSDNHHEVMNYMADHYEEFRTKAKANEGNKAGGRGYFSLYPGDAPGLGELASKAGFKDAQQAEEAVVCSFATFSNLKESKEIKTKTGLMQFMRRKGLFDPKELPSGPQK